MLRWIIQGLDVYLTYLVRSQCTVFNFILDPTGIDESLCGRNLAQARCLIQEHSEGNI